MPDTVIWVPYKYYFIPHNLLIMEGWLSSQFCNGNPKAQRSFIICPRKVNIASKGQSQHLNPGSHIPEATPLKRDSVQSVQSLSRVWFFVTPWTAVHQASSSITNSRSLLKLMSVKLMMPSNHLILCGWMWVFVFCFCFFFFAKNGLANYNP